MRPMYTLITRRSVSPADGSVFLPVPPQPIRNVVSCRNSTCWSLLLASIAVFFAFNADSAHADTFGSGENAFTISFVNIGNPGNGDDVETGDVSPYGGVPYVFRMGVTEVPQDWITKATNLGMANVTAGAWPGLQPAANMTWYEAAAFVNWLNTSMGHQAAYDLHWTGSTWTMNLWSGGQAWQLGGENLYRNKDAYYFLPSEDEWYKAAYHKNDGSTANYWVYPGGSNTIPTPVASGTGAGTAVYSQRTAGSAPAPVDNDGGLSAYGTRGQGGNAAEWQESAYDGLNDSSSEDRPTRGGWWRDIGFGLRSSGSGSRDFGSPAIEQAIVGFRVASIPESSTTVLMGSGLLFLLKRRRG